ncbi:carbohydrate esterase family 16 protein [Guyanagaster necrorhizus]|uniref:Carbohydrate esterase family 16 protein n=1 Tax=Guyanagaster necrorhizus TaxID=856835 RepID=A0A9P7VK57_9AGAR|nr:carbohydrate esterase family 16 protein [Guyanagaster necrorhizus MCA 3950]KAG7442030.1 carbohydrate esterase family 16 protein [Guyanagaster necrorhizus MCA 3950]
MSFLLLLSLPLLSFAVQVKNLVTFGDSYTDITTMGDGGTMWPVYAAGYANLSLYPFARAGATCSNKITPRPFPSIFESQLPLYFAEKHNGSITLGPEETLYTQWIGTNDVGVYSLVTGSNNASIVDVAGCMVDWVRVLYEDGARIFLLQNMVPLNETILYAPYSYPNFYFNGPRNTTEWSVFIRELVLSGNALSRAMLQALVPEVPGAHIGIFDSHGLFQDIHDNPAMYLNGTAPLNVTGAVVSCVYPEEGETGSVQCTTVFGTDRDSYLWYDELHPSEQADRIVAKQIAQVARGDENKWTTWIS